MSSTRLGSQAQISFKPCSWCHLRSTGALEEVGETNASRDRAVLRTEERLARGPPSAPGRGYNETEG